MKFFSLASLLAVFASSSVFAQELSGLSIEPRETTLGNAVAITVDVKGQNAFACGIYIAFGDGTSERIRVSSDKVPVVISHKYERVGSFGISVEGNLQVRGLSSVLPCFGSTQTAAINIKAEDFAEKEAAERAAQEAALQKATAERRAAERAAQRATTDRAAAEKAAQRAASERAVAEKSAAASARAGAAKQMPEQSAGDVATARPAPTTPKAPPVKAKSAMDL